MGTPTDIFGTIFLLVEEPMVIHTCLFTFLVFCSHGHAIFAQNAVSKGLSEDQAIAQALWLFVVPDTENTRTVDEAFEDAVEAFPRSAKIAFWQGRCKLYTRDTSGFWRDMSSAAETLSAPAALKTDIISPALQLKLRHAAEAIRKQIRRRTKEQTAASDNVAFEASLLKAITMEPTMIPAWAGLLESNDKSIAIAAADAWASVEVDNALPLYAKAAILTRDRRRDDPIDIAAIDALELGNTRPACRACDEPWPVDFSLTFPDDMPEAAAHLAGKPVTPDMLRKLAKTELSRVDALMLGNWGSGSEIHALGMLIAGQSHRLSPNDEVRYLRAFAGVDVHMIQSNRLSFTLACGRSNVFERLETMAVLHGEFSKGKQFADARHYIQSTKRKVADRYLARLAEDELWYADSLRADVDATEIMKANKQVVPVPEILVPAEVEPKLVVRDVVVGNGDMEILKLFYLERDHIYTCGLGQSPPTNPIDADEIEKLGYRTLGQTIDRVRESNLEQNTSTGLFLVARDIRMVSGIGHECWRSGYMGKRAPCIVAFTHTESVEDFRKYHPHVGVRLAQVLGPGGTLNGEDLAAVSEFTDLVVVPYERIVDQDGRLVELVRNCGLQFLVLVTKPDAHDRLKNVDCIAGAVFGELLTN